MDYDEDEDEDKDEDKDEGEIYVGWGQGLWSGYGIYQALRGFRPIVVQ